MTPGATRAFILLAAVSVCVIAGIAFVVRQNRSLIRDFQRFRVERAHQTTAADARLCRKVDRLDLALIHIVEAGAKPPKPGAYGYDYYKTHPSEATTLRRAGSQADAAVDELRKAACDPKNLPTANK